MLTITYRAAVPTDAKEIALLHAKSWQENYRGIWQDAFLDHGVIADRLKVWEDRLLYPTPNQYVLLAESADGLVGFVCGYTYHNETWGTLLDNLHVVGHLKGQGLGKKLVQAVASWSYKNAPEAPMYLWVLEDNLAARAFYDKLGAINQETVLLENPDQTFSSCCRYVWSDVRSLAT